MVFHHLNRLPARRQPQHQFNKVAARRVKAAGTIYSRGSDNQRLIQVGARVVFARQLGDRVGAQRPGRVLLGVGAAGHAVENVIGRKMHQLGVRLAAGNGQIANRQSVHQVGGLRLLLGDIHLIVGGRVQHDSRIAFGDAALHLRRVGDVDVGPLEAGDRVPPPGKFRLQLDAELSATPEYRDPIGLHFFIMNHESRARRRLTGRSR